MLIVTLSSPSSLCFVSVTHKSSLITPIMKHRHVSSHSIRHSRKMRENVILLPIPLLCFKTAEVNKSYFEMNDKHLPPHPQLSILQNKFYYSAIEWGSLNFQGWVSCLALPGDFPRFELRSGPENNRHCKFCKMVHFT